MKKVFVLFLALALSLSGCMMPQPGEEEAELKIETYEKEAYIEPKNPGSHELAVISQDFYTMSSNFQLGIYQAQIKNIGTENALLTVDKLDILDESGTVLFSFAEFYTKAPKVLAPGAIAYITTSQLMESLKAEDIPKISDYTLSYTGEATEETPRDTSHLSVTELTLMQKEAALSGIVHNSSAETLNDVNMVVVVLDGDGNLLMAEEIVVSELSANGQADFKKDVMSPNPTSDYENITVECVFY